jgi:hypothetical protein
VTAIARGIGHELGTRGQHVRFWLREHDIAVIRPEEIRQLRERRALVIAENGKAILARLSRCIEGRKGAQLLEDQKRLRARLTDQRSSAITAEARATAALVEARRRGIAGDLCRPVTGSAAPTRSPLLVQPFPAPGQLVALAYRELNLAATGSPEQGPRAG